MGVRFHLTGVVQGVGMRYHIAHLAKQHGLKGHVRNRSDGSVEGAFFGTENQIKTAIEALKTHHPGTIHSLTHEAATQSHEPETFRILT